MDDAIPNGNAHPCVELVEACGEWFVRVVEDGQELSQSFELEPYAVAFAEHKGDKLAGLIFGDTGLVHQPPNDKVDRAARCFVLFVSHRNPLDGVTKLTVTGSLAE